MSNSGAGTIRACSSMDNLSAKDRRLFEDLTKQIDKLRTELEAEKQKLRQVHRDKVIELKAKQEEFDRKLERALEVQARKRETDKQADLKSVEEKVKRQKEREIKNIWRLKEDEIKRLKRQFAREKEEAIKEVTEIERRKSVEKVHEGEDILTAKITQLTKDIFALNEHNSKLEEQVKLLTQENHEKIEVMRRMKKEHEARLESLVKQYKSDAMRETAKLKLAERRIQEKDHHLSLVEHKADMANLEREAVSEELTRVKKTIKDTPPAVPYRPATPDLINDRTTPPSPSVYNPLQNRINDLQAHCKKIEEQLINLKQENAQLRKKLSRDGGDGGDIHTNKEVDEKMKKLRKRNAELVSLAKQLDERCKALKLENEQLQSASISEDDKSAQQALRRQFARQQAKDLAEHTKQMHIKDMELESLRQQLSKVKKSEATAGNHDNGSEAGGVSSAVVSVMMMENLRMEKLLAACFQKSQGAKEVPLDPIEGFQAAADHMRQLEKENTTLHDQVKELTLASNDNTSSTACGETNTGNSVSQEQFAQLQQAKEETERLASDLEKQLVGVRQENERLKTEFSSLKSQHDTNILELQGQCDQLRQNLDEQSAENVKHKEMVEELTAECVKLKQQIPDSGSLVVTTKDLEQFTIEVEQMKEENKRLLESTSDLTNQLSAAKKRYEEVQVSVEDKEHLATRLRDELERTKRENQSIMEELGRTKTALAAVTQEKKNMAENSRSKDTPKEEVELLQLQNDMVIVKEEKSDVKVSDEVKELTKSEQHKEDLHLLEQKEQTGQEQVTTENSKPSNETPSPEKVASKPFPRRTSPSIPIGKKPATHKQLMSHTSPPKHATPRAMTNLQSEFQQAGFEIEDGYDSDDNPNTFSELPRGDEAECVSTTSLEDSLLGSESFVSLDNYNKEIGSQKQKPSRVGSAKERDRKHSQESEAHLKERKSSQEGESQLKEPQATAIAVTLTSQMQEEMLQKLVANPATGISQASETSNSSNTVEPVPLSTPSLNFDVIVNKEAGSLVDTGAAKKSVVLSEQKKPLNMEDDSSSESDSSDDDDIVIAKATATSSTAQNVALFVVKFDYDPYKMSPNPNPHQELSLTAGRYVYIYGDMDEDGFYKGQTADGKQAGLVPSNFVERVNEGEGTRRRQKLSKKRGTLQHIDEVEEIDPNSEKSTTGSVKHTLPPDNVQLMEQSIDPITHSLKMTVRWDPVEPSLDVIGYTVYVDGELYSSIAGVQTCQAELSGLVPKKIFTITVRSCTGDGRESCDQPHPLTAGGNLLVAPQKVEISVSSSLTVMWSYPIQAMKASYTPPTHFVILIDDVECCRVEAQQDGGDEENLSMTVEITEDDITECGLKLSTEHDHQLVVRCLAENMQSEDSESVTLSSDLVSQLMNSQIAAGAFITRRESSSSPMDNSVVHVPPVAKPRGMYLSSPSGDMSSSEEEESSDDDDIQIFSPINRSIRENSLSPVVSSGAMTNGSVISGYSKPARIVNDQDDTDTSRSHGMRYYRAIYNYNPMMMSPNEGLEEEELCFHEGDIIKALGDVDSDGFMEGELAGKKGLVPSNMIEEITDVDKLQSLVVDNVNNSGSGNHRKLLNGCMSRMVRARYNYNPGVDSPNENDADEELSFARGDIILVCGEVGDDGFFLGELNGKRGMVPSNFVEVISEDNGDKIDGKDIEVFAASEEDVHKASQIIKEKVEQYTPVKVTQKSVQEKKRNLLNKGKGLVNKVKKK